MPALSLAIDRYDRTEALIDGRVGIPGFDLTVFVPPVTERHHRMVHERPWDICEYPLPAYLSDRIEGRPLVALPVFPYRRFRHGYLFVRAGSRLRPADLRGGRIGIRVYSNAATMWVRGLLADEFGVRHDSVTWVCERSEEEVLDWRDPAGVRIERVAGERPIEDLLLAGEVDAITVPELLPRFAGHSGIARLLPDFVAAERDYYRRTGVFPIMHVLVAKQETVDRWPDLIHHTVAAFEEAKRLGYARISEARYLSLAWGVDAIEQQSALMGADPWPAGIRPNRKALETGIRYAHEQGIIPRPLSVEEAFPIDVEAPSPGGLRTVVVPPTSASEA